MNLQMKASQEPVEGSIPIIKKTRHQKTASAPPLPEFEYWDHEWFKRPDKNEDRP